MNEVDVRQLKVMQSQWLILTLRIEKPVLKIMSLISSNLCTASGFIMAKDLSTKILGSSGTGIESSCAAIVSINV